MIMVMHIPIGSMFVRDSTIPNISPLSDRCSVNDVPPFGPSANLLLTHALTRTRTAHWMIALMLMTPRAHRTRTLLLTVHPLPTSYPSIISLSRHCTMHMTILVTMMVRAISIPRTIMAKKGTKAIIISVGATLPVPFTFRPLYCMLPTTSVPVFRVITIEMSARAIVGTT